MTSPRPAYLGIDLGGTSIRAAVGSGDGTLSAVVRGATDAAGGPANVIERIVTLGTQAAARAGLTLAEVRSWGIGVPGPMDPRRGIVHSPPNLPGWHDVPLGDILRQRLGCPVYINNDANLAAIGELLYGAGAGHSNMIYLTVSTGIGGGIVCNGSLLLGANGGAGEVGHMTVDLNGPMCNCGNIGCVETFASGTGIARIANGRLQAGEPSILQSGATAEDVVKAAQAGDALACAVIDGAARALGAALVNLVNIFNPERIVVGGGVAQAGDLLLEPARRSVARYAMPMAAAIVQIVPAALGDDVGLHGALALAQGLAGSVVRA